MTDIEMSTKDPTSKGGTEGPLPGVKGTTTVGDEELKYRKPVFWLSVLIMLVLYGVSIYFAVIAINKYVTQPVATTLNYFEATIARPIAFPAVRICPLSPKKNLKFQRTWWLPYNETVGRTQKEYLGRASNIRSVWNPPPYKPKTQAPTPIQPSTQAPTKQPTTLAPTTLAPTLVPTSSPTSDNTTDNTTDNTDNTTDYNETFSPTPQPSFIADYDYDYFPSEPVQGDDYNFDPIKAEQKADERDKSRNCFTWNDVSNPQMSGSKRDAVYFIVDVDLPTKSAIYNTGNCSEAESLGRVVSCTPNQQVDAIDSSTDAMGVEVTLYPQQKDPLDSQSLFIPANTITKMRMTAKKTNRFEVDTPEWEYIATTSQVFFPSSGDDFRIDNFTATTVGHVATVDQLVFLEIKFGDMSVTEVTETKTYEAFNAFGDATAIFGFFTGFALWGGMNVAQMFLLAVSKFKPTKNLLFEPQHEEK